jgi:hypothetical protein
MPVYNPGWPVTEVLDQLTLPGIEEEPGSPYYDPSQDIGLPYDPLEEEVPNWEELTEGYTEEAVNPLMHSLQSAAYNPWAENIAREKFRLGSSQIAKELEAKKMNALLSLDEFSKAKRRGGFVGAGRYQESGDIFKQRVESDVRKGVSAKKQAYIGAQESIIGAREKQREELWNIYSLWLSGSPDRLEEGWGLDPGDGDYIEGDIQGPPESGWAEEDPSLMPGAEGITEFLNQADICGTEGLPTEIYAQNDCPGWTWWGYETCPEGFTYTGEGWSGCEEASP